MTSTAAVADRGEDEEPPVELILRTETGAVEPGSWVDGKVDEARFVAVAAVAAATAAELAAADRSVGERALAVVLADVSGRLMTRGVRLGSVEVDVGVPRTAVDFILQQLETGFLGAAGGAAFVFAASRAENMWNAVAERLRRGDVPTGSVEKMLPEDLDEWEVRYPEGKRERYKGKKKREAMTRGEKGKRRVHAADEPRLPKRKRRRKRGREL